MGKCYSLNSSVHVEHIATQKQHQEIATYHKLILQKDVSGLASYFTDNKEARIAPFPGDDEIRNQLEVSIQEVMTSVLSGLEKDPLPTNNANADVKGSTKYLTHLAAKTGDFCQMLLLLTANASSVAEKDDFDNLPIYYTCLYGHSLCCAWLLLIMQTNNVLLGAGEIDRCCVNALIPEIKQLVLGKIDLKEYIKGKCNGKSVKSKPKPGNSRDTNSNTQSSSATQQSGDKDNSTQNPHSSIDDAAADNAVTDSKAVASTISESEVTTEDASKPIVDGSKAVVDETAEKELEEEEEVFGLGALFGEDEDG